jgi:hypothetical protein
MHENKENEENSIRQCGWTDLIVGFAVVGAQHHPSAFDRRRLINHQVTFSSTIALRTMRAGQNSRRKEGENLVQKKKDEKEKNAMNATLQGTAEPCG